MLEKVVPIPFLGKDISAWLYRTTRWVTGHPWKSAGIVLACVAGSIVYEAQVTHKGRIVSPNVKNHLEYEVRSSPKEDLHEVPPELAATNEEVMKRSKKAMANAKEMLAQTQDPEKQTELRAIIEKEQQIQKGVQNTTMYVRSGQLNVREPHWEIRNNERNWNIMSRDQQQQKDHYWYRYERSKDDDFGRNTYSRP